MDREKEYIATVYFDPASFSVYNCNTKEEAEKSAFELAVNLASCMGYDVSVDYVEVKEVE